MIDGSLFLVKHWANGCVVFDRQFGDTYALDSTTTAIFSAVQDGNLCFSSLIESIKLQSPDVAMNELEARVHGAMAHLRYLGLVDADLN
jgi:uncharacterized protein with von Willebrand factor type A (vWA) domain